MASDGFGFRSAAVLGGDPLYRLLVTFPLTFLAGALLSNLVFYGGADLVGRASNGVAGFIDFRATMVNVHCD